MPVARAATVWRRLGLASLLIALALGFAGCVAIKGYPATSYDPEAELKALAKYYGADIAQKYDAAKNPADKKAARDEVLNGRIRAIDIQFLEFQKAFYSEAVTGNVGTDLGVLLLGATKTLLENRSQQFRSIFH